MRNTSCAMLFLIGLSVSLLGGCGGDSSGGSTAGQVPETIVATSSDDQITATIAAKTVLYTDERKSTPAVGAIAVEVNHLQFISQGGTVPGSAAGYIDAKTTVNPLCVYGQLVGDVQKAPDGSGVFFDVTITADGELVRAVGAPISMNILLPDGYAAPGSTVDFYSYDGGVLWTREGSATVKTDGSIDIKTAKLSLAVTKFIDWVPPGNGLIPKGTYPVTGSPLGAFTFVIGASPDYEVSAKTALGIDIPVTDGSISLQVGSSTLYDFAATLTFGADTYLFSGTLDKISGLMTGTYAGAASGTWTALSAFKALIDQAKALAGTDPTLNQLLRIQSENSGGYNLPLAIFDNAVVEPGRAFDNAYYLGYKGTGCWAITNANGDIYLIDSLWNSSDAENIIAPGLVALGLDPANVKGVLVTHGHGDHFGGASYFAENYGSKIYMGAVDEAYMRVLPPRPGSTPSPMPDVTDFFVDGDDVDLGGGLVVTAVMTPGHTPGGFSFIFPVYDEGVKHMAAVWGGSGTAVPDYPGQSTNPLDIAYPTRTKVNYVESVDYFSSYTWPRGVDVIVGVHGFMDNNIRKIDILRNRKPGDVNPFILGPDVYHRYEQILRTVCLAYLAEVI